MDEDGSTTLVGPRHRERTPVRVDMPNVHDPRQPVAWSSMQIPREVQGDEGYCHNSVRMQSSAGL